MSIVVGGEVVEHTGLCGAVGMIADIDVVVINDDTRS